MNNRQPIATIFLGTFCLALLLFVSCDEVPLDVFDKLDDTPEVGAVDTNLITANTTFGFNLFNEIRKTEQNKNIFISPFSVSVALAMTLNGAANETEQEMMNVLQLQGLNSESINAGYGQLQHKLQASDPKVTLTLANSLWARQGIQFKQDFLQRNIQFFRAEISTLDFDDPSASQTINQWVNTKTNGKIQKSLVIKLTQPRFCSLSMPSISKALGRESLIHQRQKMVRSISETAMKSRYQ